MQSYHSSYNTPTNQSTFGFLTKEEIENSPSRPWITFEEEKKNRSETCLLISDVGRALRLPQYTIATASVYFHRFYSCKSFTNHDRSLMAMASLFLAAKTEETRRKVKFVIQAYQVVKGLKHSPTDTEAYNRLRDSIFQAERYLLDTIEFNFAVSHPYQYVLEAVKKLFPKKNESDEPSKLSHQVAQIAWLLVNDSLRTTLCLCYPPQLISVAVLKLAVRSLQFKEKEKIGDMKILQTDYKLTSDTNAFDSSRINRTLGVDVNPDMLKENVMNDIMQQIMDIYESRKGNNTPWFYTEH